MNLLLVRILFITGRETRSPRLPGLFYDLIICRSGSFLRHTAFGITLIGLVAIPADQQRSDEQEDGNDDHCPGAAGGDTTLRHNRLVEVASRDIGGCQRGDVHEEHGPECKGRILFLLFQPDSDDQQAKARHQLVCRAEHLP